MSTFLAKGETIERKWYVLDAADKPMGRTAATAAHLLRGKQKPEYTTNVDCGDFVIILNVDRAILTGKKAEQKYYRTHSGYAGGLKEVKYRIFMKEKPELAMKLAVRGMLPSNHVGRTSLSRLKLFCGSEHSHAAQKPEAWAGNE